MKGRGLTAMARWLLILLVWAATGSVRAQDAAPAPAAPASAVPMPSGPAADLPPEDRSLRWVLQVEAPEELRLLLERHLDLARFQRTAQDELITRSELLRLLEATPAEARALLETQGHFEAEVQASLIDPQRPDDRSVTVGSTAGSGPGGLATRLLGDVDALLQNIPGVRQITGSGSGASTQEVASVTVRVTVTPGPRTRVRQVRIEFEGALSVEADAGDPRALALVEQVRQQWSLPVGRAHTQEAWSGAKTAVLALLRAEGYPRATWSGTVAQVDAAQQQSSLFLVADSGPLHRFGEPVFTGLAQVQAGSLRALMNFTPGDPLREQDLLDFQDRLIKTNLFDSVSVMVDPDVQRTEAVPVQVTLREKARLQTTLGVGYSDTTGPRLTVEHTDQSLMGLPWLAKTKLQLGRLNGSASIDLTSHPLGNAHRNLMSGALTYARESDLDVRSMRARVGRTQDNDRIERLYYLEWLRAATSELDGTTVDDTSAVTVNYQWVWRQLDHPIVPTTGFSVSASIGSGRSYAAYPRDNGWFTRATGRYTGYWMMGELWHGQVRLELAEVFARDSVAVPYTLLFRAGGDDSVRGYSYQGLGPSNASGTAVGGKVMGTTSLELARPFVRRQPSLLGAVFVDAGNAASSWKEFGLVKGYGVGVRWRSPVGPLRLDLAYGEKVRRVRMHISVGLTF
ncbi:autotransporter secretion outer membrane protein TamA [Sphaerotilus hippei]|uniref:Autotransporter secretion outer membrane protein TamA n=1 Tax=Sphaerotilus hippei TaxID=744406 RepID=A0A318H1J5_9BURK|nr:BamA/TamA family outer membrane protein [Sphaerotilus hippei]PXW96275.1 autotransporter secretion outer membrane protein TamA [Sphaerotilus hippei]